MKPLRIAMWSGPRNISTAMMRAWENRTDTVVWDEPFYGYYLHTRGTPHPGADEVIAAQGADWQAVVDRLTGPVPNGKSIFYQKHMTHHMLPGVELHWFDQLTNCFLIRDPIEVVASYARRRADVTADDLGYREQARLFERVCAQGERIPPVVDAADVLQEPERMLRLLCSAVGVSFTTRMLSWPPGPRETDGVWAKYWYESVQLSTGFEPFRRRDIRLSSPLQVIADACRPSYEKLYAHRLVR